MPVTIRPSDHGSRSWAGRRYRHASSPDVLLHYTLTDDSRTSPPRARHVVQSSFAGLERKDNVFAAKNGFVYSCMEAYNEHHRLIIRPEDVWFAILTQFSAYVNGHAEELRGLFCAHDAQRELHIDVDLNGVVVDHGRLAFAMARLMQGNIRDEGLRQWIMPAFTTTTKTDQAVASVVFMGAMQKFFTYSWGTRCGIPAVTLLGERSDWVEIRRRAERLATYGAEPARWLRVLAPVLDGFVDGFADPAGEAARRFWRGVCDEHVPNGSGSTTYSGWITAFCFWDEGGRCLHGSKDGDEVRLTRSQLPSGFTKVPVTLLDDGVAIPTEMVAGSVAIKASRPEETLRAERGGGNDTIQPEIGWFMYKT
ncbi:Uu.00g057610.m01.CDS01 [Anthostomella pinea]|uniref:Uu.00g057610.m01.CDS01 n=1 Tax=Anthostomella pinea TaxID=933095 RepID=A0AAI8VRS4_9PEZI|nr:Uu.00g057610.m01.CDS01 [Anthostomella pinea]